MTNYNRRHKIRDTRGLDGKRVRIQTALARVIGFAHGKDRHGNPTLDAILEGGGSVRVRT